MIELQKKIEIKFKNKDLLEQAFIHRSYVNENPNSKLHHNERLEFLGDAVLELIVTKYLYNNYQKKSEGILTTWRAALVKGRNLTRVARELKLGELLKLSKGEEKSGGRKKGMILADCLEAVIGAIYLDQGFKTSEKFVKKYIIKYLNQIIKKGEYIDAKTYLQEKCQEDKGITPTYEVLEEKGPDHQKKFKIGVYLDQKLIGLGQGASKQKAQQSAALVALKKEEITSGKDS
jgi:ribonuclease III